MKAKFHHWLGKPASWAGAAVVVLLILLVTGTVRDPNFWRTTEQRGDALMHAGKFGEAAKVYTDPWRIGVAQYRDGDFKGAAKTFARVPGADGAYNAGNAQLMHGQYDLAIADFDRALSLRPGWKDAKENKAIALARKNKIEASGKDREKESADAYDPDKIVMDQNGDDKNTKPTEIIEQDTTDAGFQATWLRRVQTTPGDFLRAKFAYQAAHAADAKGGRP
jgi:Ca-activated chloride channel homolog